MILPSADNGIPWFVVVSYNPAGYIEDDDAKDWKADEMLAPRVRHKFAENWGVSLVRPGKTMD
jgi:uncharacterized membrane-anchored protein